MHGADCAALKARSDAAKAREPRQDRKVATVSGHFWVTPGRLAGASEFAHDGTLTSKRGCTTFFFYPTAEIYRIRVPCSRSVFGKQALPAVREFYITNEVRFSYITSGHCAHDNSIATPRTPVEHHPSRARASCSSTRAAETGSALSHTCTCQSPSARLDAHTPVCL